MKRIILLLLLIDMMLESNLKMTDQKRKELLSKYTKKFTLDNLEELKIYVEKFQSNEFKDTIQYDPAQIEKILQLYNFPESYDFLEKTNLTAKVKNQGNCGCCWSHAATTALAYRYHKIGIEVDLSPQDGLSCYIKDCERGNYLIDPQLNLIKNGTLTEGCLPFSSEDGKTIEKCPTSCKDGSEFKRFFAQNAYMTQDYYSKDTFYEIVSLIIDQLITNGPVVSAITVYKDFYDLHADPQRCHDEVYSYDEKSQIVGGHAVVIVGYGYLNNKFYWLIQNSWGDKACDKGFVKVEFGQIGVEKVAFSEPYINNQGIIPEDIPVSLNSISYGCNIKLSTSSSYNKWKNTLDISFKNDKNSYNFNFQCGSNEILQKGKILNCYFEIKNYFTYKGTYTFHTSQSLGTENNFNLDNTFKGKSFQFYGYDSISAIYTKNQYYYISEEGSRILLSYSTQGLDDSELPPIYANINNLIALSDCQKFTLSEEINLDLIYCDIKQKEVSYFEDLSTQSDSPMVYNLLCGYVTSTSTIAYKLDKTKYPVFRVKNLYLPNKKEITSDDLLIANVNVEGSVSQFKDESMFIIYTNIEQSNKNSTYMTLCLTGVPSVITNNFNLSCNLNIAQKTSLKYDNIYFLPYYIPYESKYPYEIIIKKVIKGKSEYDPEPEPDPDPKPEPGPQPQPVPSSSNYSKKSLSFIILCLLLF